MKTLNDKITYETTFPSSTVDETKTYTVNYDGNVIFQGTVFVPKSDTAQTIEICLNDILKSEVEKMTVLDEYNNNEYDPIRRYTITINGKSHSLGDVFLGYFNKLHNYSIRPLMPKTVVAINPAKKQLAPMLQGIDDYPLNNIPSQKLDLYPRYPFVNTDQLNFSQLFNVGSDHNEIDYGIMDKDENIYICGGFSHKNYVDNLVCPLEDMLESLPIVPGKKDIVLSTSTLGTKTKITGTKLWLITVEDQNVWNAQETWEFADALGYDRFYCEHFYVQQSGSETLYFIFETNDPQKDIVDVAYETIEYRRFYWNYQEISQAELVYPKMFNNSGWQGDRSYMKDICSTILNITIDEAEQWGLDEDKYNVWLTYKKYRIYNSEQINVFRNYLDADPQSGRFGVNYSEYFDTDSFAYDTEIYKTTYKEESIPATIKIGEFDECPAKYYLQWIDRYKGVQCQPFNGKSSASISYNVQNITNRYNEKRPASFENTYSFDLNTGWLTDKEYPLFESIFVSPDLKLYDTENDMSYKVIVVDKQFVEKTYKNQKKMFGFNIKLAVNTTENILY